MTQNELEKALEASKERRDRRLDELLRDDPVLRGAVYRDQHPQPAENEYRRWRTASR